MKLCLTPGTTLTISVEEGEDFLEITFTNTEIKVVGLIPGNVVAGEGVIHHERFGRERRGKKGA